MSWTREDASHLVARTCFDGSVALVEELFSLGRRGAVRALLHPQSSPSVVRGGQDETQGLGGNLGLLHALLACTQPLRIRLAWFWFEHFAPALRLAGPATPLSQWQALSGQAAGRYRDFLPALYQHGLIAGSLASLQGEAEASRVMGSIHGDTVVRERPAVLAPPRETLNRLFDRDDTMNLVCDRLYRWLVHARPDEAERAQMARLWQRGGGQITPILEGLLDSPAFWDRGLRGRQPKDEMRFALGLVRRLGLAITPALLTKLDDHLTQTLPSWPGIEADLLAASVTARASGAALMQRYQFARHAVFGVDGAGVVDRLLGGVPRRLSPQAFVTLLAQRLGIPTLGAPTRAALSEHLGAAPVTPADDPLRLLGAIYLLVCSVEYQHC